MKPLYMDPREKDAIAAIVEQLRSYYRHGIDNEHLLEIVASEAENQGIRAVISVPFARRLIEEGLI
jgi:hypothetical protein